MMAEREMVPEEARVREAPAATEVGIAGLMNKRTMLAEAIDGVGLIIKQMKEKRTTLEKEIEEESVEIKNLKETLAKVREYIEEEGRGLDELARKRSGVEHEADEVSDRKSVV